MQVDLLSGLHGLLALAAYFLGLSVLVQVLQEMYKFLFSSKNVLPAS